MKISEKEISRLIENNSADRSRSRRIAVRSQERSQEDLHGAVAVLPEDAITALEVQRITKLVNELPDIREERVRALKAQIDKGTYHVSGEDIADLIIRRALADNTSL